MCSTLLCDCTYANVLTNIFGVFPKIALLLTWRGSLPFILEHKDNL